MTALLPTQQVSRSSNLQVLHGNAKSGPKLGSFKDSLQALHRCRCQALPFAIEKIGIGPIAAPTYPAPQLIKLRQTQPVGVVDYKGIQH